MGVMEIVGKKGSEVTFLTFHHTAASLCPVVTECNICCPGINMAPEQGIAVGV